MHFFHTLAWLLAVFFVVLFSSVSGAGDFFNTQIESQAQIDVNSINRDTDFDAIVNAGEPNFVLSFDEFNKIMGENASNPLLFLDTYVNHIIELRNVIVMSIKQPTRNVFGTNLVLRGKTAERPILVDSFYFIPSRRNELISLKKDDSVNIRGFYYNPGANFGGPSLVGCRIVP